MSFLKQLVSKKTNKSSSSIEKSKDINNTTYTNLNSSSTSIDTILTKYQMPSEEELNEAVKNNSFNANLDQFMNMHMNI